MAVLATLVVALLFAALSAELTAPPGEQRSKAPPGRADRARLPADVPGPPELVRAVDDVPQDCLGALAAPEGSSALMREQRRLRIEGFLDGQQGALRRELVADLAGYRPQRQTVFESGLSAAMFWRYAPPNPPGERRLSYAEFEELEEVRQRDGIEALVERGDASLLDARWGATTYAGHLIQKHGEAFQAALPTSAAALALGLHELAVAIRAGVGEAAFAALLALAPVDARGTWHNGANLAKVAAIHNRSAILRGLVARGVDPAASPFWPTGRSVLARLPQLRAI